MSDNVVFQTSAATPPALTVVAADQASYSGDSLALIQLTRHVAVTGSEGSRSVVELYGTRSDIFTGAGNGTTVDMATRPAARFAIQVTGTGSTPGAWNVVLEGSLNGTTFTTIATHSDSTNTNGAVAWATAVDTPVLYFRARCVSLTLGGATNVVAVILGVS